MDDGTLIFHPILGAYVLVDFLKVYEKTSDDRAIEYVEYLAEMLVQKGDNSYDELVFSYSESDGLSSVPGQFYSALTQAWYIKAFSQLSKHRPGKYDRALTRLWGSLLKPMSEGGVLVEKSYGWIVEEYPHAPAFYTLNGWLTVIRWVIQSEPQLAKAGVDVKEFVDRNLDAVVHLLPLYDARFVWNSRYQLTGFTRLRLTCQTGSELRVRSMSVNIPGEDPIDADMSGGSTSRWSTRLERSSSRRTQFNIVQSLVSYPEPNSVVVEMGTSESTVVTVEIGEGQYSPDATGMPTTSWKTIAELDCSPGEASYSFEIPFDGIDLFAYPTNFKKVIDGVWYNGYHFVHVIDLAEIYAYSPRPLLREYALKWLEYIEHWPELSVLDDPKYSFESHVYGDKLERFVLKLMGEKA